VRAPVTLTSLPLLHDPEGRSGRDRLELLTALINGPSSDLAHAAEDDGMAEEPDGLEVTA
jgi:hypothetical protein